MLEIYPASKRGSTNYDWLESRHTFSFGDYYDPNRMRFGVLRVINEDSVAPGKGFSTHSHSNMEIISYVLSGALEHKDSMGNTAVINQHDWQVMSAGTGITHSEYNHSQFDEVRFLQIWILPKHKNISPVYSQKNFALEGHTLGNLKLVISPSGRDGSIAINQDLDVYVGALSNQHNRLTHQINSQNKAWIQVTVGDLVVNGKKLKQGDGAALANVTDLHFTADEAAEFILFDMP